MPSMTLTTIAVADQTFPAEEVKRRLQEELQPAAEDSTLLHAEWEPLLDSLQIVSAVMTLEDLFSFKLPLDKLIRPGGYSSPGEVVEDILDGLRHQWDEHSKPKVRE